MEKKWPKVKSKNPCPVCGNHSWYLCMQRYDYDGKTVSVVPDMLAGITNADKIQTLVEFLLADDVVDFCTNCGTGIT
jgi:hypothetical protein